MLFWTFSLKPGIVAFQRLWLIFQRIAETTVIFATNSPKQSRDWTVCRHYRNLEGRKLNSGKYLFLKIDSCLLFSNRCFGTGSPKLFTYLGVGLVSAARSLSQILGRELVEIPIIGYLPPACVDFLRNCDERESYVNFWKGLARMCSTGKGVCAPIIFDCSSQADVYDDTNWRRFLKCLFFKNQRL